MDENIYQEACTVSPSRIPADKSAPGPNPVEETSTDDAATGYIPGVGMRNPGQSRVWTSAVKKTISVLSLVLNCCLLGVVIFLAMTVSDLQLSVKQQEQKTGMTTDKLRMDMSDLKLSINQLEAMARMTTANMTSVSFGLQQAMEDIKGLSGRLKEHEEAGMTAGLQENYRKMHDVLAQRLGKIETSVKDLKVTCPHGYQKYRQLCYKVFYSRKTFHDSAEKCRADGGTLAMPRDSGINTFLDSLIKKTNGDQQQEGPPWYWFWFGLSDRHQEGQWEWMDGTALGTGYSRWREGEPNNHDPGWRLAGENCAEYAFYDIPKSYVWNDASCSNRQYFICQVAASDTPVKMGTLREKLGHDEDQRSLLCAMPEDQTVKASSLQLKDVERHRCHATRVPACASCSIPTDCLAVGAHKVSDIDGPTTSKAVVSGTKNRDRDIEAKEDDASCSEDSHNLSQVDPGAVSRSYIRSKPVTLQNKGIEATEIEPKKSAVEMKADGGSRLKLPRKRTIDLTDSGDASEEGVSGSAGVNLKRNQIVPLGAEPPPGKRTKRVSHLPKSVDDTKHGKQPKLKRAIAVSSQNCQGKKAKESYNNTGNGETTSHKRRNNRRKNIAVTAKANGNVSMGDFGECSQSKSKRKKQVGEAVSFADVRQRRGRSVPCATCRSDTRTRRGTSRNSRVTPQESHVDAASRQRLQRKKKQKAPERDFRVENDTGTTHVSETESQQGWAVIRDALRSQTEWADTSLHDIDAADSNGLRKSSNWKTDKHSDAACSSRWERRIRPRRTNYLEPGAFLTPRLLTRPDSTYLDIVAGETVLVNNIEHDPCRWEAADEVELVACQDGNTPHGYRDGSGRICRLYRQYLDIVNGEVLRQVACELWEYVS
ncbi:hypothetical protein Bbelb_004850 [Branchiostoma belcheri]|nr:hypothetical protein Bbelb_004850 [Branchiostoma belcheri]